jgi:hypothetical protein
MAHPEPTALVVGGEPDLTVASGLFAVGLAAVHLLVGRLDVPRPRRRSLSVAGGATIAYVFVLVFPEIGEAVLVAVESTNGPATFLQRETAAYTVVLLGFVTFYGVHAYVTQRTGESATASGIVFGVHLGSFCAYNALIGYLLFHQELPGLANQFFYVLAMALHFLINDEAFRRQHGDEYDRLGRWVLAAAVLLGAAVGATTIIDEGTLAVLFAFLGGSIVFNVVKEELPDPKVSRFGWFVAGALGYTAILLAV